MSKLRIVNTWGEASTRATDAPPLERNAVPSTDEIRMEEIHDLMERIDVGTSGRVGNTWFGVLIEYRDGLTRHELIRSNSEDGALALARRTYKGAASIAITGHGTRYTGK